MINPSITHELILQHGLSHDEYEKILSILGRVPSFEELGVFSVMWSEHCSYKNSRSELRKFPTNGPSVLVKAGEENAGIIDIGDGWAVAFKIESHNHPSAIDPFQGAATGVGGIVRDIFTMGARPIFLMDSLRFGPIDTEGEQSKINRRLFAGVVAGIAHYGNCIGIPTIAGEVYFDTSYSGNPLVNVFCLGLLRHDQIARGAAVGVGNPIFYVGAETGADGLAGASFASRELSEESKLDRPAVQVGDPFREKLLLEACLELIATDAIVGIQDMGAAGLICATSETANRAGTGVEIDIQLVPQRAKGQTPYEVLLSESQERMLVIVKKGKEDIIKKIFVKWDLPYAEIGKVTDNGMVCVRNGCDIVVNVPARSLTADAPLYFRDATLISTPSLLDLSTVPEVDPVIILPKLLKHPSIASKRWVWRQYDHMVGTGTAVLPGADAAVFIIREANKILAATTDCNAIYCRLDPFGGARIAVAESARNLACSGAVPIGVTDNLNFGNPYKPENFYQLRAAVEGISEGCRAFNIPVTGGNVSLYNENPLGAIDPTPTISMIGIIEHVSHITTHNFKEAGDKIYLIGEIGNEIGASHYLLAIHDRKEGVPPALDFEKEKLIHASLLGAIRKGYIRSAHDCSEGGIAVAIAESIFATGLGASIDLGATKERPDVVLFNETQSRIVISVQSSHADALEKDLKNNEVPFLKIGEVVTQSELCISIRENCYQWNIASLQEAFESAIPRLMEL